MKKIRWGVVLLSVVVILSSALITSCKSTGNDTTSKNSIILDWYMMNPNNNMATKDVEMVENEANKTIFPATGAEIKFHFYDRNSYGEKVKIMQESGEEMDIVFCSGSSPFGKEAYLDIKDMLQQYAPDIMAKVDDVAWQAVTVNNAIRVIPGQGPWSRTYGWALKKDLVDKYQFDYKSVKTLKDLEPFLAAVKSNDSNSTPVLMTRGGYLFPSGQQTWCNSVAGCIVYDTNAKEFVRQLVDNDETIDRYRLIWEWYQKGYIPKDALAMDSYQSEAKTGKYAVLNNTGKYDSTSEASTSFYGFQTVETYAGIDKNMDASGVVPVSNAIAATCPCPQKALEVLNLIWKDTDLSNLLAYGIEGVNYTINEERSAEIGSKSVTPKSGQEMTYAVYHNWLGPLWDQWDSTWNTIENLNNLRNINETVKAQGSLPECFGFFFNKESYDTYVASVGAVMSAAKPILETGSAPNFDEYLKEINVSLTDAGIDTLLAEVNRQYDEWLQAK